MKKKEKTIQYITTCFDCPDNKITCSNCKNRIDCNGCKICHTLPNEYCIHCDVGCTHEPFCQYRKEWIYSEQQLISQIGDTPCQECPYDYVCGNTEGHMCPIEIEKKGDLLKKTPYKNNNKKKEKNVSIATTHFVNKPKVWDTGITCIVDCHHKAEGIKLKFSLETYLKITYLQEQFQDIEFTVYGNAIKQEDGTYLLSDIVIPKQKAGFASVDDIDCDGSYNLILHKHPGDTPGGFSSDDKEFANSNHDFSILIGSKNMNGIIGEARIKTDCGRYMRVPLEVIIELPSVTDTFFLESTKNIEKKTYEVIQQDWGQRDWKCY